VIEIRFHGRGWQGAVTSAEILVAAAFRDGKEAQAFPFFGVERRGAPVQAFSRIDEKRIRLHQNVYEPDYLIVLDETLLKSMNVFEGLKEKALHSLQARNRQARSLLRSRPKRFLPSTRMESRAVCWENP